MLRINGRDYKLRYPINTLCTIKNIALYCFSLLFEIIYIHIVFIGG